MNSSAISNYSASRLQPTEPLSPAQLSALTGLSSLSPKDPFAAIFELQMSQYEEQTSLAQQGITLQSAEKKSALEQARQSVEKALEQEKQGGFWNFIADIAKGIGAVASVVAGAVAGIFTGGVSLVGGVVLAGAILSASSMVMSLAQVDLPIGEVEIFGNKIPINLRSIVDCAAICCGITGGIAALSAGGIHAASSMAKLGETAAKNLSILNTIESSVSGVSTAAQSVTGGISTAHQYFAKEEQINASQYDLQAKTIAQQLQTEFEEIRQSLKARGEALSDWIELNQQQHDTKNSTFEAIRSR